MDKLLRDKKAIIIFIAPALLLFTVVLFIPICQSVYYSFCEYKGLTAPKFIGLTNYRNMLKDKSLVFALKNSLFFLIFSCVTQLIIGLLLAGLLTNIEKGRNLFKNIIYLPCVLSSTALGLLWMFIFSPKLGVNQLLAKFGVEGPKWLMDTSGFIILPMWVIAFVALWQYVGQSMMLYMAQISGISKSLYEASYIDGCSKVKSFIHITLPLIRPMVATAMSLNAIGSLKFFDLIYNMTEGGPNHRTEVLATHLYTQGFKFNKYGYASAIGVILIVLCLAVTAFINKVVKTESYEM
ncbi:MAG: sugar ABC transporter permease [Lachnospiraceae bacterium]|nr:sugar ABC transporter permease [Lachnospiraceae bacterium]MDD7147708.1 sugar ABC transporter permease [Lachnospiraceae bacterium]MDY4069990.1 sugar ABC transporter permease [Lachnospiraceae bacterium]